MSKWKWMGLILFAAAVGWFVSLRYFDGQSPIARTDVGQKAIQEALKVGAPKPPEGLLVAKVGEFIPALSLKDLNGVTQELRKMGQGQQPMLINFWATWCGPCIQEIPELVKFAEDQDQILVIGIALDDPQAAKGFVTRFKMNYPQLWDEVGPRDASVSLGNPRSVLPYSVLISADGRLLKQKVGPFHKGDIERWVSAN